MYVSMKGMLQRANEGNYAVMAINCFNIETARAVISAAQDLRAPIIVNIVQEHMVNHCDSELIAPIVKLLAQRASVEVALNFDHGEEIGYLKKALHDGYSSVMVDASRYDLEGNIKMTKEIVEFARQFDASVEGEIGCMGGSEGGNYTNDASKCTGRRCCDDVCLYCCQWNSACNKRRCKQPYGNNRICGFRSGIWSGSKYRSAF